MKKYLPYLFTALFTVVAFIYNSWPLGYLLDNATARYGVPSDLEDPHHPYSWLFIVCDIISALILMGLSLYMARRITSVKMKVAWAGLCIGIFIFGFFTGFGAAAPDHCHGRFSLCVNVLDNTISIDGLETAIAQAGLLIALISSAMLTQGLSKAYKLVSWGFLFVWFGFGLVFLQRAANYMNVHSVEQIFLVLCGVGLVSIGANVDKLKIHA